MKTPILDIPPTTVIVSRLSEVTKEGRLLRSMLRLAKQRDETTGAVKVAGNEIEVVTCK